ncbi:hypothetical protein [Pedobacter sp.]|uniref:phosphoribosyltransferase-like protein n=1 Tax=Pedobacter sp. TaxID=1411316 RepID=UPI0031D0DCA7
MTVAEFEEELYRKVKVLNETIWEHRANRPSIDKWLANFTDAKEKTHALFLLSQFMYFGSLQMRELLKCLFRDLYKYPVVEKIRKSNSDTMDASIINTAFKTSQTQTRFLGIGNPSESGTHLLYFFRQENKLPKDLFINTHEIFFNNGATITLRNPNIRHYVFIDDFCGSGTQAKSYSSTIVEIIKKIDPTIEASYLMLFATKSGCEEVISGTSFDTVSAVVELDDSFKYFHASSRYFKNISAHIDKTFLQALCEKHGLDLIKSLYTQNGLTDPQLSISANRDKLGYKDCQLLIGFHHNTPDNTLPIIWYEEDLIEWFPVFRRYNKNYGI